ncbi:ADP-ribosylglycohydrolase family protein [Micromonospora noduli]|uniref:ADP-ribosylglycohydrolase family protein n=1 Tax=Micromonospora noduli TaxID=709876 RepID=UPI00343DF491
MTNATPAQVSAARGCMLGLTLGDALGATAGTIPDSGLLNATSAGQLACFTAEGIIRGHIRCVLKGNSHPRGQVWHAYHRWATMQGITGIKRWQDQDWPDGWLAEVPALAARRGSAPATVAALQSSMMGTVETPVATSVGAHGLTRSLPAGLCDWWGSPPGPFAADVAALAHAAEAQGAAAIGATIVAYCGKGDRFEEAVAGAERECRNLPAGPTHLPLVAEALAAARATPADQAVLTRLAPKATAVSALAGAVYVVASHPEREQTGQALLFAASTAFGRHVAPAAGAFLGSLHGADALPQGLVSRLELAWVADVLARDLVTEFVDGPAGSGYEPPTDPYWWERYPGW